MKKAFIIISITLIVTNIQAQETKTLLGTDRPSVTSISGYGGPLIFATQMNDELELSMVARAGQCLIENSHWEGLDSGR